ncbi:hypothetical protein OG523_00735 [Streptomyces virginiae]|uniref:hypothetical protein n=1 Tax=Streptomyces virginiae TaxID=1961 RepID=UPI00225605C8|nr:hypothetical protein [Streptomyces virginiae]MCX5174374.1 hypothetical protein [Streptomyces virginiae]
MPYRDADHTTRMAEHRIERAYRERFTRAQHAQDETDKLLAHTLDKRSRRLTQPMGTTRAHAGGTSGT